MNKILIILSLVLLASCAPNEVPYENLVERQGVHYEINSQTPFTGIFVMYHENGKLYYKGTLKDGKEDGLSESYHENGQLITKGTLKDDKQVGLYERYYENGQLDRKGNYKDGKQVGLWESYHENGQLLLKTCYKNGEEVDISYCEK